MVRNLEAKETLSALRQEARRLKAELALCQEQAVLLQRAAAQARESERERLTLELHDGAVQALVSAHQYLAALESQVEITSPLKPLVARALTQVRQALSEARDLINSHPPALPASTLASALESELADFRAGGSCVVEFVARPFRLEPERELALYRIFQEALSNVRRHAQAPRLRVELELTPPHVLLQVRDWGRGFDPQGADAAALGGRGLASMRRRAELLGGRCQLESSPGQGTTVLCQVPAGPWSEVELGAYPDSHRR
ncbi:MAG: ATP-binding protein [Chloroflexi bacterium]|nr:ATP-binding protein [Chloroflexota bacterium]